MGGNKRGRILAVLLAALAVRIAFLPGTSGSDIPQFLAFAETMGFPCVYAHGLPSGMEWPYPWPYPYGPAFLVLLKAVYYAACPCNLEYGIVGDSYRVVVDPIWAASLKLLYTVFDAVIVYLLARRSPWAGLVYALHPLALYVTAIYGMLDPIPAALLLAGGLAALQGRRALGGILAGAAVAVKGTVLPGALALIIAAPASAPWALSAAALGYSTLIACPGDTGFFHAVLSSIGSPGLPRPLVYSFNGVMSLAVYLYDNGYAWAERLPGLWPLFFAPALISAILYALYRRDPLASALIGYAAFIATYWRVNPQYVPAVIALGLAAAPSLCRIQKAGLILSTAASALWALGYPLGFWARVHMPRETYAAPILDAISLGVADQRFYVLVTMVFTLGLYLIVYGWPLCGKSTSSSEA